MLYLEKDQTVELDQHPRLQTLSINSHKNIFGIRVLPSDEYSSKIKGKSHDKVLDKIGPSEYKSSNMSFI